MRQLPSHVHHIAAFHERREQLERQAELAVLTGRIRALCQRAALVLVDVTIYAELDEPAQPTMARTELTLLALSEGPGVNARAAAIGYRSQPRNGRGRFLSKAWLRAAESYLTTDLAWFRAPVTPSQEG